MFIFATSLTKYAQHVVWHVASLSKYKSAVELDDFVKTNFDLNHQHFRFDSMQFCSTCRENLLKTPKESAIFTEMVAAVC